MFMMIPYIADELSTEPCLGQLACWLQKPELIPDEDLRL